MENTATLDLSMFKLKQGTSSDTSVKTLARYYQDGIINLRPSYQRNEVINRKKASGLIESAILGIPLPPLYLFKDNDGKLEVIDGQQRLITFLGFLGRLTDMKTKLNGFSLIGLTILKNLNGKDFENDHFKYSLNEKILDFTIKTFTFEEEKGFEPTLKYEIFERLNKNPFPIKPNSFELWNCIYLSDFTRMIKEIVKTDDFNYGISRRSPDSLDLRMDNENDILRYITLLRNYDKLKDRNDLPKSMMLQEVEGHFLNKTPIPEIDFIKKDFLKILRKTRILFGTSNVIGQLVNDTTRRKTVYPNLTLMDVLLIALSDEDEKFIMKYRDELLNIITDFFKEDDNRAIIQNSKRGNARITNPYSDRVEYLKSKTFEIVRTKYGVQKSKRINIRDLSLVDKLMEKQNGICPYCKNQIRPSDKFEIDHIQSVDDFGSNEELNLALLHEICNREKSNKKIIME
jgi:5-methylcytosine-specific restriction endonuclease McrA